MNNLRIKEIDSYKGDTDGFASLNNAIWSKAVDDEYRHQKARMLIDTSERVFSILLKYDKEDRNTFIKINRIIGATLCGLSKRLETMLDSSSNRIKKAVQNKIYRESLAWPNNKRNDPEYEKEYTGIRNDILHSFDVR